MPRFLESIAEEVALRRSHGEVRILLAIMIVNRKSLPVVEFPCSRSLGMDGWHNRLEARIRYSKHIRREAPGKLTPPRPKSSPGWNSISWSEANPRWYGR